MLDALFGSLLTTLRLLTVFVCAFATLPASAETAIEETSEPTETTENTTEANSNLMAETVPTAPVSVAASMSNIGTVANVAGAATESIALDIPKHLPTTLTLKTNAVGWALAMVNVGVEYEFTPQWSFEFPIYYSCWDYFSRDTKFRIFAFIPEFKYFIDAEEHFGVGAHIGFAYYNWAFGGDYRYQTHKRICPVGGAGVSFTYRKRFGHSQRWGFECSVGFGAYLNKYDRYPQNSCDCDPIDLSHYVDGKCICRNFTKFRKAFVGCDKLSVSITYNFDFNKRKQ